MSIQEHHEKKGSICQIKCAPTIAHMRHCQPHDCNVRSNRLETNPSLFYHVNSRAPRKKESICQFKNTMKKGSIMSIQEHHEKKNQYQIKSITKKKGSICQFKSTTKKKDQYIKSNVPQPSHICVIANHMIAMSEVIDWRLILPSFTFSNQEHHEKKDQYVNSRVP